MVGGLGGDVGLGLGVDRGALVGDLSDIAVDVVGSVLHVLDPAVREGDGVRAGHNTVGIAGLSSVEVGLGVVVGNSVGVGVGLWELLLVDNSNRGGVSRGSVHNRGRGGVSRGSMHNRGRGMIGRGSVDNRGGMVDSMGDKRGSMDSMVGNCVMGNNRGSVVHSVMSHRSSVDKRGSMMDSVRNNWGVDGVVSHRVGDSVGDRVSDGVDSVVGRDNLAMSAVGNSGGTSVGKMGAGGCESSAVVDGLVGGDSGGRLGQAEQGEAHESLHFCSVGVLVGLMSRQS